MEYSKSKVNWAGEILANEHSTNEEKSEATEILEYWRALHSYPLHIFQMTLKRKSHKIDKKDLVVQRLKRAPTIIKKLKRPYNGKKPTMNLSQMQDIGGCRSVVSNMQLLNKLSKTYLESRYHKLKNKKDYIQNPKCDGYRGIHLIYEFYSKKESKFNGMLIEIQMRTQLQHIWATAVETVDFFTKQAIKSNQGKAEWIEFFKLVSSAFAIMENSKIIEKTPLEEKELYLRIKELEKKLNVIKKMQTWRITPSLPKVKEIKKDKIKFFLLKLNISNESKNKPALEISGYKGKEEEKALKDYAELEKKYLDNDNYDIVLVGSEALKELEKAYPNYFMDCEKFITELERITKKYDESLLNKLKYMLNIEIKK